MTENGSPFDFPCEIPVKVFGRNDDEFRDAVISIVNTHFPEPRDRDIAERLSRADRFLSFTITVWVEHRQQIDAFYTELSGHDAVIMVL